MSISPVLAIKARHPEEPECELITQAKSGDSKAFERIYGKHVGHVYAICLRMLADRSWAEDLTQQIFVRAWVKLPSFRFESSFASWLHRLAVNMVLGELGSSRGKLNRTVSLTDLQPTAGCGVESSPHILLDLEKAIASLPSQARAIFVLHDIEGYKHQEIADAMKLAVGTCKAQLFRARRLLREALES
jgi:RNA polymerase sigma-70 factor (ECF subfamily)